MAEEMNLTGVIEKIHQEAKGEEISIGDVAAALDHRGYGPLLFTPALMVVLPTGGIPGVPAAMALLTVLIAAQIVMGRKSPWLPKRLCALSCKTARFETVRKKAAPTLRRIDKLMKPRLGRIVSGGAVRVIAALCILLALIIPPLEILPFAGSVPALAIVLFGLGISTRDGVVILLGATVALASLWAAGAALFL